MHILNKDELRELTGYRKPADQVAHLRKHGITPFVCAKTGEPRVYDVAVLQCMTKPTTTKFTGNREAFK